MAAPSVGPPACKACPQALGPQLQRPHAVLPGALARLPRGSGLQGPRRLPPAAVVSTPGVDGLDLAFPPVEAASMRRRRLPGDHDQHVDWRLPRKLWRCPPGQHAGVLAVRRPAPAHHAQDRPGGVAEPKLPPAAGKRRGGCDRELRDEVPMPGAQDRVGEDREPALAGPARAWGGARGAGAAAGAARVQVLGAVRGQRPGSRRGRRASSAAADVAERDRVERHPARRRVREHRGDHHAQAGGERGAGQDAHRRRCQGTGASRLGGTRG